MYALLKSFDISVQIKFMYNLTSLKFLISRLNSSRSRAVYAIVNVSKK